VKFILFFIIIFINKKMHVKSKTVKSKTVKSKTEKYNKIIIINKRDKKTKKKKFFKVSKCFP